MNKISTKYYTIKDYASYKKVSRQTIYNWITLNKIIKDKDYIVLSDGSYAIILNDRTK